MKKTVKIHDFRHQAALSLKDENLQKILGHTLAYSNQKRNAAVESFPNWEEMRNQAAQIRNFIISNLDIQLQKFTAQAEANGMKVLWAEDARQANDLILKIIKSKEAKKVVKSKSMLTEEIGLNVALEKHGLDVFETDLGEFIAQLAHQPPSHITAPIIHLSKKEAGKILCDYLQMPFTDDPAELTLMAREYLRKHFLSAQIGITGVNFGLVDEGALVILENEGNARLSITLPPVHIAVMGLERLLPSAHELPLFLNLLTVSATGQKLTNYVSVIRSARKSDEPDGVEELYLILVDNGRSRVLALKKYRQILHCIRCGACMNVCPIYGRVGGHAYNSVYPGPLGAVLSPLLFSLPYYSQEPFASSLCGRCAEVCPVKIPLHHFLLELRADIVTARLKPTWEKYLFKMWSYLLTHHQLYRFAEKFLRILQPLFSRKGKGMFVPGWSRTRY
ncbi:LutB/LldF family L-lactate oxidation iron-sulfur protein, partial [candidate division CSSED10-310 bacterium]